MVGGERRSGAWRRRTAQTPIPPPTRARPALPLATQVRAQSRQELVYKQGSAGITKASVSITFHNDDPANGPSGYEDKELITVTRQVSMPARVASGRRVEALQP